MAEHQTFEQVRPVIEPLQCAHSFDVLPFEHLPGVIEDPPAHQHLATLGQGHHPRTDIELDAIQVLGLEPGGVLLDHHLSQVYPDPFLQGHRLSLIQELQPGLQNQREPHSVRRLGK